MFILILPEQDHAFGVYCPSVYGEFIEIYSAGERGTLPVVQSGVKLILECSRV